MTTAALQASVDEAISRLHAAMARVALGDVSAIKAVYSLTDDATSFYGWGGFEKGWEAVSKRWDWAGQQFKGGRSAISASRWSSPAICSSSPTSRLTAISAWPGSMV